MDNGLLCYNVQKISSRERALDMLRAKLQQLKVGYCNLVLNEKTYLKLDNETKWIAFQDHEAIRLMLEVEFAGTDFLNER